MSDTPPMTNATSMNGRDRTPEIDSKREKRHRENDEDDRDRHSSRRHRRDDGDDEGRERDPDRERERRERHRRHYENETEEERAERRRRHERREDETEEERAERHRRRRERERERERDGRDARDERTPRGYEDHERSARESTRERDYATSQRDRSRDSHRSHRSSHHSRDVGRDEAAMARRSMAPEERERQRAMRDSEMRDERGYRNDRSLERDYGRRDRDDYRDRRGPNPYSPRMRRSPPREFIARGDLPPPPPPPDHSDMPGPPTQDPASQLLHEVDSEARSVFVSQLAARLTSQDLGMFFEHKLGRGAVRDARVVMDRVSRRSKGIGYVELDAVELVNKALALSGQIVMGIPISIQLTESEKNRDGVDIASIMAGGQHSRGIPKPVQSNIHFPPLSTGLAIPPGVDMEKNRYASIPYHRLFVTNIASTLNRDDLTQVFEAFGPIEFVDLHYNFNGQSRETAYVQFRDLAAAQMAVDAMNGFELAGRNIKVHAFQERSQMPDQIDDPRRAPRMDATARQQLMRKLAREEPGAPVSQPRRPEPPQNTEPTKYLLVYPMFNPDNETERNWDLDLAEDVKGEVEEKYGLVKRIKVDKMSAGEVYIEFETIRNADAAVKGLNGRFFSGNKLQASFITETLFKAHL